MQSIKEINSRNKHGILEMAVLNHIFLDEDVWPSENILYRS